MKFSPILLAAVVVAASPTGIFASLKGIDNVVSELDSDSSTNLRDRRLKRKGKGKLGRVPFGSKSSDETDNSDDTDDDDVYEVWGSDQSNSVQGAGALGVVGSYLWIWGSSGKTALVLFYIICIRIYTQLYVLTYIQLLFLYLYL